VSAARQLQGVLAISVYAQQHFFRNSQHRIKFVFISCQLRDNH
jgi:hypothetical protein